jgi:DNA-3-methyladenine glycosylase II
VAVKATRKAIETLRNGDPVMGRLIEEHGALVRRDLKRERPGDAYGALLRSIVGQQLSTKAASTIYGRMLDLFGGHAPTPKQLLKADPDKIRAAGLSRPKIAYLRDLAQHVEEGTLELERLPDLPDEEVAAQLTAIKGLGQWTADMFLMFHLGRPDVLPVGDQGIRRAVKVEYRLRKFPDPKRLEKIAKPWRPHRTLACLYLWSSLDNTPA